MFSFKLIHTSWTTRHVCVKFVSFSWESKDLKIHGLLCTFYTYTIWIDLVFSVYVICIDQHKWHYNTNKFLNDLSNQASCIRDRLVPNPISILCILPDI